MSAKNEAPRWRRWASTSRAAWLRPADSSVAGVGCAIGSVARDHPVRVFADEKCKRRDAGGNDAANGSVVLAQRGRMRREAAPADRAGEAELIENVRIVVRDAARENLLFPGSCRRFESLQLLQRFERAALAEQARLRRDVLPAEQPAHELRGSHGLNLFAQRSQREAVNAREQAAVAPFRFRSLDESVNWPRKMEPAASMRSIVFSTSAAARPRNSARPGIVTGPEMRQPAGDAGEESVFARRLLRFDFR